MVFAAHYTRAYPNGQLAAGLLGFTNAPGENGTLDFVKEWVNWGASPRAAQTLALAAKVRALLDGRYNVSFEDVRRVCLPAMRHRVLLNFHAESDRIDSEEVLRQLVAKVPPPRA